MRQKQPEAGGCQQDNQAGHGQARMTPEIDGMPGSGRYEHHRQNAVPPAPGSVGHGQPAAHKCGQAERQQKPPCQDAEHHARLEGGDDGDKSPIRRDTGFEASWHHKEQRVQEHDGNAGVPDRFMDL